VGEPDARGQDGAGEHELRRRERAVQGWGLYQQFGRGDVLGGAGEMVWDPAVNMWFSRGFLHLGGGSMYIPNEYQMKLDGNHVFGVCG